MKKKIFPCDPSLQDNKTSSSGVESSHQHNTRLAQNTPLLCSVIREETRTSALTYMGIPILLWIRSFHTVQRSLASEGLAWDVFDTNRGGVTR